jgi:uncharacterized repeat protein (TIGR03803 family)
VLLAAVLGVFISTASSARAQTYSVLYSFKGSPDGAVPVAELVGDSAGNLYGTTAFGGAYLYYGTVFKLDAAGNETVLYSFKGYPDDGWDPHAGLVRDSAGNRYGTTYSGGAYRWGTVFKLDAAGNETVLYSFKGTPDGGFPIAGLVRDSAGKLYGTTFYGGSCWYSDGCGTVFKLDAAGNERVLHSFHGEPDGRYPDAGLVRDHAGNLYGTTEQGGASSVGTVFKLDMAGNETVLYSFRDSPDGALPHAGLVRDHAGNLYGTMLRGARLVLERSSSWT